MKKFVACAACIVLVLLVVYHFAGEKDLATDNLTRVSEASFDIDMSVGGSSDVTAFLVGLFSDEDGERLSFNGGGSVTASGIDGSARTGKYTLVQYEDGSAILRCTFPDGSEAYTFRLVTASGSFSLTDSRGKSVTYKPCQE